MAVFTGFLTAMVVFFFFFVYQVMVKYFCVVKERISLSVSFYAIVSVCIIEHIITLFCFLVGFGWLLCFTLNEWNIMEILWMISYFSFLFLFLFLFVQSFDCSKLILLPRTSSLTNNFNQTLLSVRCWAAILSLIFMRLMYHTDRFDFRRSHRPSDREWVRFGLSFEECACIGLYRVCYRNG